MIVIFSNFFGYIEKNLRAGQATNFSKAGNKIFI